MDHRQTHLRPVPAEGGIPEHVTVHTFGEVPKHDKPRNVLDEAAQCPSRALAVSAICTLLKINEHSHLIDLHLSDDQRWRKIPREARLKELAEWLYAECFELMDFVLVPGISTIGD